MSFVPAKKKALIFKYLDTPEEERIPKKQFLKENGIMRVTFYKGELLYAQEHAEEMKQNRLKMLKKREAADKLGDMVTPDTEKWTEVERAIYQKALDGTVKAQELYARLKGKLKDEIKVEIGLSADEITRRNLKAERDLQEWYEQRGVGGQRVEEEQEEHPLLSE